MPCWLGYLILGRAATRSVGRRTMTERPNEMAIRASPASVAGRMGRASRFLALANLVLLSVALLMLACLWAWGSSNPHDPNIIGRGVLIFVFSNALVIGGGLLVAALTLV